MQKNKPFADKQRVETGFTEEDFWIMFNDITRNVEFGKVEITIIAGAIDSIKVTSNYKVEQKIDIKGRKIVELK